MDFSRACHEYDCRLLCNICRFLHRIVRIRNYQFKMGTDLLSTPQDYWQQQSPPRAVSPHIDSVFKAASSLVVLSSKSLVADIRCDPSNSGDKIFSKMKFSAMRRLTQRAPDWWESARFQVVCVA